MVYTALTEADARGELILVEHGLCYYHLRQDGQLTIYAILVSEKHRRQGIGTRLLGRLRRLPGARTIFAKCPADLPSNHWYRNRGFTLEERVRGMNHWRLTL